VDRQHDRDFGIMGEKPSHPEITGLAGERAAAAAWSMKAMHKMIVTSATYRQSSRVDAEHQKRDPQNVLYAQGAAASVEAEDRAGHRAVCFGMLSEKIGGPSVFPPQPAGVEQLSYGPTPWKTSAGEDRYRRGMYTFLKRTALYPGLTTFDAPTAEVTCTRRIRSNTPLQALTTLNDEVFVEAARAMAQRLISQGPDDVDGRIREAFKLCLAREPQATELSQIKTFLDEQTKRMSTKALDPIKLAGFDPKAPPKDKDPVELAAWTTVSRAILNLDETVNARVTHVAWPSRPCVFENAWARRPCHGREL
jgi:hypothetical protein